MANEEDRIDIFADFHNEVSRPARAAADDVDHLGDSADKTAVSMEDMGNESDKSSKKVKKVGNESEKSSRSVNKYGKETRKAANETSRWNNYLDKLLAKLGIVDRETKKKSGRGSGIWNFMKTLTRWSLLIGGIVTGLGFLSKAVYGLGAAAVAGVAGMAPLTGMLVAYPGYFAAIVQGIGTVKLATAGMGNLIKVLGDPAATAEDIEKALKNMSQNQVLFARAVVDSKDAWVGLKKEVGSRFFADLNTEFKDLTKNYVPILTKYLGRTADNLHDVVIEASNWLNSKRGMKVMSDIMGDNAYNSGQLSEGLFHAARFMAQLVRAGGPMLRRMSRDFNGLMAGLDSKAGRNQSGLTRFFNQSYDLFKKTNTVLGYYLRGLYNIASESDALSSFMGRKLTNIGKTFEEWSGSKQGRADVRQWFEDMIPVVREIGRWVRDLSVGVNDITMGNGDFLTLSKTLRKDFLPAATGFIKWAEHSMVPVFETISKVIGNLHESGITGGALRVLHSLVDGIVALSEALAHMPEPAKRLATAAATLTSGYGIFKFLTGSAGDKVISRMTGGLLGGKSGAVQDVFVTNWAMMRGGGVGAGGRGGGPGVIAAGERGTRAAGRTRWNPFRNPGARRAPTSRLGRLGSGAKNLFKRGGAGLTRFISPGSLALTAAAYALGPELGTRGQGALNGAMWGSLLGPLGLLGGGLLGLGAAGSKERANRVTNQGFITQNRRKASIDQIVGNYRGIQGDLRNESPSMMRLWKSTEATNPGSTPLASYNAQLEKLNNEMQRRTGFTVAQWIKMDDQAKQSALNRISALKQLDNLQGKIDRARWAKMPDPFDNRSKAKEAAVAGHFRQDPSIPVPNKTGGKMPDTRAPSGVMAVTRKSGMYLDAMNALIDQTTNKFAHLRATGALNLKQLGSVINDNLVKRLKQLPPEVVTKIDTPGAINSIADVNKLNKQYDLTPKQKITLLKLVGTPQALAQAKQVQDHLNAIHDKSVGVNVNVDFQFEKIPKAVQDKLGFNGLMFAGGDTKAGASYIAGEFGPEAWISRSGALKIVGRNGPELVAPGSGAFVPTSATLDPWAGATGNAPDWAVQGLRKAMAGFTGNTAVQHESGAFGSPLPPINIGPIYATSDVDVERAVKKALADAQRDAEERR